MKCLPLLLICSGCAPADGFNPDIAQHAIELWHLGPDSEPFARIVPHPIPGRPELCVAITDTQTEWWGEFGVYAIKDGKVAWQAVGGGDPMEQSILAVRGLRLPGFSGPIIEVFGQTHMGNGNLYLYELQDRELVLLLDTWAVDCHEDRYTFKSGRRTVPGFFLR